MGVLVPFQRLRRRGGRTRLPGAWSPYLRRRALVPAEIRMMVWAGLLVGLLAFQALRWWPGQPALAPAAPLRDPAPPAAARVDPWAESRRSAAILRAQEGPPPAIGATPAAVRAQNRRATVDPASVRVVDGDTIDIAGTRIRIADIDTPEIFSPRCRAEAELGGRATRRLRALLDQGPFDLVPVGRDEDRYGRKLRIAVRGGRSLGDRLVAEGLARTYDGGPRAGWC